MSRSTRSAAAGSSRDRAPSGANGALPWILFTARSRQFEREFPQWSVELIEPLMPFRYSCPAAFRCGP